jgi:hypothetical protein
MADSTADLTTPSLDTLSDEIERVIDEQRKRVDNIDTKCGLALAFAGALIALTREDARLLVVCGRAVAAVAGLVALAVVFPWDEPEPVRPKYLLRHIDSKMRPTRGFLFMFKARYYTALGLLFMRKRFGLRLAVVVLAISVTLLTLGVTLCKAKGVEA